MGTRTLRRYEAKNVSIAFSASLSGELNAEGLCLSGVIMPSEWTTANLTFQASNASGGTYRSVYDNGGTEVNITASAARTIVFTAADKEALEPLQYLKFRSGTAGTAVRQSGDRTLIALLRS